MARQRVAWGWCSWRMRIGRSVNHHEGRARDGLFATRGAIAAARRRRVDWAAAGSSYRPAPSSIVTAGRSHRDEHSVGSKTFIACLHYSGRVPIMTPSVAVPAFLITSLASSASVGSRLKRRMSTGHPQDAMSDHFTGGM